MIIYKNVVSVKLVQKSRCAAGFESSVFTIRWQHYHCLFCSEGFEGLKSSQFFPLSANHPSAHSWSYPRHSILFTTQTSPQNRTKQNRVNTICNHECHCQVRTKALPSQRRHFPRQSWRWFYRGEQSIQQLQLRKKPNLMRIIAIATFAYWSVEDRGNRSFRTPGILPPIVLPADRSRARGFRDRGQPVVLFEGQRRPLCLRPKWGTGLVLYRSRILCGSVLEEENTNERNDMSRK